MMFTCVVISIFIDVLLISFFAINIEQMILIYLFSMHI